VTYSEFLDRVRAADLDGLENLVVLQSTDSTNLFARRLLEELPDGQPLATTLVLSYEQKAGMGRQQRAWTSPGGQGLYCSLLWSLADPEDASVLPLAVGVGLCQALREVGVAASIKWPNDLLVGGAKIGGVLIELPALRQRPQPVAIIGFGVNTSTDRETLEALGATSVDRATGRMVDATELLSLLLREVGKELADAHRREDLDVRYRELLTHRIGDELSWRQAGERWSGRFVGLDGRGRLRVETVGGERLIAAGDIIEV
jgi:BirA family biotin operon repressor/biotin-[acetyl-CoA-carboxylase] ligase